MKRNMKRAMDRLEIDEGIRPLIRQMWKHGYETLHSCEGHEPSIEKTYSFNKETRQMEFVKESYSPNLRYATYKRGTGDGWLEENAESFGLVDVVECTSFDPFTEKSILMTAYYAKKPSKAYTLFKKMQLRLK